ncbi:hypothetical protein MHB50_08565 [Siminovitchia sp. FSL H7-0308]|uniref:hypothetical protein n=1 Tax=unclassified Siminovitchia TaxID=2837530 RepID=UPI0030CF9AD6
MSYNEKCWNFQDAFWYLGQVFTDFCHSLLKCNSHLTSGPLNSNINTKSMIARVNNLNDLDVFVHLKVTINDDVDETFQPYYCQTIRVPACSHALFNVIDATDFNTSRGYTVWFEIYFAHPGPHIDPACDNVHVYFAERSDLPDVTVANSHILTEILHKQFIPHDAACTIPCPEQVKKKIGLTTHDDHVLPECSLDDVSCKKTSEKGNM